jgi:hypothetical protein
LLKSIAAQVDSCADYNIKFSKIVRGQDFNLEVDEKRRREEAEDKPQLLN